MTNVTPIQQPAVESLRNAEMIANGFMALTKGDDREAFGSIVRLIRDALAKLSEPNAAMLGAVEQALNFHHAAIEAHADDWQRYLRDTSAAILHAQLKGAL